jgi:hypothetical protein
LPRTATLTPSISAKDPLRPHLGRASVGKFSCFRVQETLDEDPNVQTVDGPVVVEVAFETG